MTHTILRNVSFKILASAGIVAVIAACTPPEHPPAYQDAHPIEVIEEIVTIGLSAPSSAGRVEATERDGFARFLRIYHTRAKGIVTVHVDENRSGGIERDALVSRSLKALADGGVSAHSVRVMPDNLGHEGGAPVFMSFDAYDAVAPECGDWSDGHSFNWANDAHANYGCAYQRNLALSVANPGDFLRSQPMSAFDGSRGVVNVISYRSGASGDAGAAAAE